MSTGSTASHDKQVPVPIKTAYGIGAIAEGAKNAGFDVFLGLYYVTVLGLPGTLSGLALLLALLVDAVTDPLVGSISDNFRSRWGRRHPFMVAAAVPMGVCFFLLFAPPAGLSEGQLFAWLLVLSIGTRVSLTFYKVPADALGPEMTDHYDERTTLMSFRFAIGTAGAVLLQVVGWLFFFEDKTTVAEGRLDLDNFPAFGAFVGILVASVILIASFGTRSVIPRLRDVGEHARFSARRFLEGLRAAFRSHSLRVLLGTAIAASTALGVAEVLGVYMNTWFWEFPSEGMAALAAFTAIPAALAVVTARRISTLIGDKRKAFIRLAIFAISWGPLAVIARLLGIAPDNGTFWIYPFVLGHSAILVFVSVQIGILLSSMLLDVTDEVDVVTGERHEGIVMSMLSFAGKCTSGLGNFVGLSALQWIGFPSGEAAAVDVVPEAAVVRLGLITGPGLIVFYLVALALMVRMRMTRERYAEIQAELASRGRDVPTAR